VICMPSSFSSNRSVRAFLSSVASLHRVWRRCLDAIVSGEAGYRGPVAPSRLSALLAVVVASGAKTGRSPDSQIEPRDVHRQPARRCTRIHRELLKLGIENQCSSGDGPYLKPAELAMHKPPVLLRAEI
jgi:hypothetical protein